MSVSLEDQRRALLEQIEASRAVYRRMLAGDHTADVVRVGLAGHSLSAQDSAGTTRRPAPGTAMAVSRQRPGGRNQALQWAVDHPLWVAGGVALLVLLLPRAAAARRRHSRDNARRDSDREQVMQTARSSGTARALLTAGMLLMRDPRRLQAAGRLLATGWHWLQRRRAQRSRPAAPPATTSRWLH